MPTFFYGQLAPLTVPEVVTAHRFHTDGANHIIETFYCPWNCQVRAMRYQITESTVFTVTAAVIGLATGDRDGALVADMAESLTTIPTATAAADTITEVQFSTPVEVTAGDSVLCQVHTAGAGAGLAGIGRVWAVLIPETM